MAIGVSEVGQEGVEGTPKSKWEPEWSVTTPGGSEVGIARDDHCFVILSHGADGEWHTTNHQPK